MALAWVGIMPLLFWGSTIINLANFNDTLADGFKIEVEPGVLEAMGR